MKRFRIPPFTSLYSFPFPSYNCLIKYFLYKHRELQQDKKILKTWISKAGCSALNKYPQELLLFSC